MVKYKVYMKNGRSSVVKSDKLTISNNGVLILEKKVKDHNQQTISTPIFIAAQGEWMYSIVLEEDMVEEYENSELSKS